MISCTPCRVSGFQWARDSRNSVRHAPYAMTELLPFELKPPSGRWKPQNNLLVRARAPARGVGWCDCELTSRPHVLTSRHSIHAEKGENSRHAILPWNLENGMEIGYCSLLVCTQAQTFGRTTLYECLLTSVKSHNTCLIGTAMLAGHVTSSSPKCAALHKGRSGLSTLW